MAAWNDPFGERIRANVQRCDRCGTELDEGDNAYFTGLDMLCLDCAEAEAKAQAEQDTVEPQSSAWPPARDCPQRATSARRRQGARPTARRVRRAR